VRAGRLIHMLLILQRRGRLTATALSEELGVTPRTVLRDVDALHEAGVPIYTTQGSGGGIELVAGFRTVLTGLTVEEAEAVLLVGQPVLARILGLSEPAESAHRKIMEAMTPSLRSRAESLGAWLLADPLGWEENAPNGLDRVAVAIARAVVTELAIGDTTLSVRPMGLVTKSGRWFLLHLGPAGVVPLRLEGLSSVRLTRTTFSRPEGFDLGASWARLLREGGHQLNVSRST